MECPVCSGRLRPTEKCGVEVDICPTCKGLWLDRGKLETILSQAAALLAEPNAPLPATSYPARAPQHDGDHEHGRQRRRGSWIGDPLGGLGGDN